MRGARGGKHVEDEFTVLAQDVVRDLVEPFNLKSTGVGSLVVRENNTAVMLVPPLTFTFRAQRVEGVSIPTLLTVTGHFVTLVDRKGPKGPRWAYDDVRAEYAPTNKLAYKVAVAEAVRELGPRVVPRRILEWLEVPSLYA